MLRAPAHEVEALCVFLLPQEVRAQKLEELRTLKEQAAEAERKLALHANNDPALLQEMSASCQLCHLQSCNIAHPKSMSKCIYLYWFLIWSVLSSGRPLVQCRVGKHSAVFFDTCKIMSYNSYGLYSDAKVDTILYNGTFVVKLPES